MLQSLAEPQATLLVLVMSDDKRMHVQYCESDGPRVG
jgi:hypothetical protein